MKKEILNRAKKIKLIAMDLDGVLTKGEMIVLESGEEVKIWDIRDRLAYTLLKKSGLDINLAWITGRASKQVEIRAAELKIKYFYQGIPDKLAPFEEIVKIGNYEYSQIAFLGDDWLDIPLLRRAGLSICPKDAVPEAKKAAHYISKYNGGYGVFREAVEIILRAQGAYNRVFGIYNK
ncbi:MAG: HAD hydrolase family protein [Elusimicrobia bacterium]|nr:HAD hydrolase family protein [Elusimicrobiota bacterium]MBU2615258.1 HAD hydrolase family protein [Elusimicrobiota bacterium]